MNRLVCQTTPIFSDWFLLSICPHVSRGVWIIPTSVQILYIFLRAIDFSSSRHLPFMTITSLFLPIFISISYTLWFACFFILTSMSSSQFATHMTKSFKVKIAVWVLVLAFGILFLNFSHLFIKSVLEVIRFIANILLSRCELFTLLTIANF